MSVTLPVQDKFGNISGVVGTDLTMDDFLSDAMYFRPSKLSYVFIIDSFGKNRFHLNVLLYINIHLFKGYVIYHPLFKYPTDHDVKHVEISTFESDDNMEEVIESMKKYNP